MRAVYFPIVFKSSQKLDKHFPVIDAHYEMCFKPQDVFLCSEL